MSNTKIRLTADRAARFLDRAILRGGLDTATAADAQQLLDAIDAGPVKGLAGRAEALVAAGFRRGALAVAAADTPRGVKAGVAAIKAVAQLAESLGIVTDPVTDPVTDSEVETDTATDTVADTDTAPEWSAA